MTDVLASEPASTSPASAINDAAAEGIGGASLSPGRLALRRFFRHRVAFGATLLLGLIALAVILAPLIAPYSQNQRVPGSHLLAHPASKYWFGTDDIGRDLYSRILWGGRVSLFIGLSVAISSGIIGTILGAVAGFRGGRLDNFLMRVTDLFLALPILVVLMIIRQLPKVDHGKQNAWAMILGKPGSLRLMITLLTIVGWMGTARIVRGIVLSLKEKEFVEASRALGASDWRIITRHLVPNSIGPIVVSMTFTVAAAIGLESTLSYFGFGIDVQKSSWGILLSNSKGAITAHQWWLVVFPSLALLLTILAVNFIGDGLRDALDPKQSKGRA